MEGASQASSAAADDVRLTAREWVATDIGVQILKEMEEKGLPVSPTLD